MIYSAKLLIKLALVLQYDDNKNDGEKYVFKFHDVSDDYEDMQNDI